MMMMMVEAVKRLASRRVEGLESLGDSELVAICQEELPNDLTHFRELLRRYEGLVYNTCRKVLGNSHDAEEVAQDALIQVFHKLHQFQGKSQFKTWLYTIVQNYCRSRISKIIRKREKQEAIENESSTKDDVVLPEVENRALSEQVEKVFESLRDSDREILTLKFVSGLTLEEIADILDLGLSAAKMRLYRSMEKFKEVYTRIENETPHPVNTQ